MARITRREFMELHGFDDEEMDKIDALVKIFDGTIIEIIDKKHLTN